MKFGRRMHLVNVMPKSSNAERNDSAMPLIVAELNLAQTFLDIAETADRREQRLKNHAGAEKAYATMARY